MARGLCPLKATMAPWPPASRPAGGGRGPGTGAARQTGGRESGAGGEGREGERGEGGGVTHRVQGPGAEESDASREGLGEGT